MIRHLFRFCLIISITAHFLVFGGYLVSRYWPGSLEMDNGMDLEKADIELDIPPELIGERLITRAGRETGMGGRLEKRRS
jgi:hypothetical protein